MNATTYRAAYLQQAHGCTVLTGPEHASLSDEDLRAEALAEADRAGIVDMDAGDDFAASPCLTLGAFNDLLTIGDWTA